MTGFYCNLPDSWCVLIKTGQLLLFPIQSKKTSLPTSKEEQERQHLQKQQHLGSLAVPGHSLVPTT
jgi:hypothetical protein